MSATLQEVPQLKKFLVKNNTAGWLGVVVLNAKGEELGENIEPHGTKWLSEAEMILTARAPRDPADNPFEEQTFVGINGDGARQEFKMRPLTLVYDDARFVPNERYVPTQDAPKDLSPASAQTAAVEPLPVASPPSSGAAPATPPPVPPVVTAAAPVRVPPPPAPEPEQSWIAAPEAPGEVLSGALSGSDEAADAVSAPEPDGERFVPSVAGAQAAVQTPGAEEHAAVVDPAIGEETGAAQPPAVPAPVGEYARAEEVGSPGAPTSNGSTENGG